MSYCRISREGELSDVYCYRNDAAIEIAVAACRMPACDGRELTTEQLLSLEPEEIDLPQAGEHYVVANEYEAIDKLLDLRRAGFHVPQGALTQLCYEAFHNPALTERQPLVFKDEVGPEPVAFLAAKISDQIEKTRFKGSNEDA